ncbi:T9SS type A sorting domain-containing protein [Polaribacter pectinis]|uniref:T9SS type A sorting domain-containing protein n=1 Tax=Polaribacter pectinis TaxID=2738844 RepID=A0A7G9L6V6_9FLAO|nr:T9SS type A sorting domain-containing protein [Polaribacter pectinis]QNM84355.1 T9SS type A sorting domain-containing protein [Polaribacter pectinis]
MKKNIFLILLFTGFSIYSQEYQKMIDDGNFSVKKIQETAEKYFEGKDKGRGSGYKQYKRWEYFALKQQDKNGLIKDPVYLYDEWNQYSKKQNIKNENSARGFNDNWSEVGPKYWDDTSGWNPGVGRISGFAVEKTNQNHIIVGSIGGGIWKTTNAGVNWQPLTDNHGNMFAYSLAIDPINNSTYYWGSSSGRIYKSTDSGAVWTPIANAGNSNILKILIHPTNSNIIFATSENSGLYKSTDAGNSWVNVISGSSYDVEFDPNDSSIVFASGSKIHRSTDTGSNFTEITGLGTGVKMLGVTKADSNKVYIVEASGGTFGDFYFSLDNGLSFFKVTSHSGKNYFGYESNASDNRGQAPRDMGIAVSQTNADEVHIAGINTWRSTDGGLNFTITSQWQPSEAINENIGYCHADVDDIEFIGDNLYAITDGGIYICEDSPTLNKDYYRDLTTGLGIRQFYLFGVSQTDPVIISGGSQDNGSSVLRSDGTWVDWLGADGFESLIDVNDPNTIYGSIYNGTFYKSTNQGTSYTNLPRPETTGWVTPFEQDNTGTLYFAGKKLYRSDDAGSTWVADNFDFDNFINQIKIAPSNKDYIYASTEGGKMYSAVSTPVGSIWEEITGFSGNINSISIHPTDHLKVAISVTGSSEKVYITSDGGSTWTGYSNNLPNFTAYALVWDNNGRDGLYLGMDYGVYYIDNQFTEWNLFNTGLPNVKVTELEINYADNNLYVATYGRGVWKSPRSNGVLNIENHILESLNVYPNPATTKLNISWDKSENVALRLFNTNGQLLYYNKETSLTKPLEINTSQFASGIYYLKVSSHKGNYTKKIVLK